MSALEQAALLSKREISSYELVRLYLERIQSLNPRLHAFVSVFERSLTIARHKDGERRRRPDTLPLFHGVPTAIKDLNIVRWTPTRWGSRGLPTTVLPFDDLNVAPLRRAGFVFLGKLATSELGAMPLTEPDIHPPTRNPWALAHSPGGSSGGSGSAVAAALVPIAQGSDGGGSIRIPAAFCHLVGLKPSRGRLKNQFGARDQRMLHTAGPIAQTVDDVAALLDVMSGTLDGRRHWAPAPSRPFRELARQTPRRMRIRFATCSGHGSTDPEIEAEVRRATRVLAQLGHDIEESPQPVPVALEEFIVLWQYQIGQTPFVSWRRTQPITRFLASAGKKLRTREVIALHDALKARVHATFSEGDLWITPTVALPPPKLGEFRDLAPSDALIKAAQYAALTAPVNVSGQPAISLPLGLTRAGLPFGLQLIGREFAEGDILAVARQLEQAMPWRQRRAPEWHEHEHEHQHEVPSRRMPAQDRAL
jgi:amidase